MADRTATATVVLAADVANSGTFTVQYPTGTSQKSFNAGLAGPNGYVLVNANDKWTVAASKVSFTFGASNITVTNNSSVTWAAGSSVYLNFDRQDGNDVVTLQIPVFLAAITGAGDVVTDIRPGVAGTLEYWEFVVTQPVTTAAKLATLNMEIDTTNVVGADLALTSANCTPLGKVAASGAPTSANVLVPESTLSVEAASVTAFAEGSGFLNIRIRKTPSYA